ncbi:MAG: hypothetical protein Q9216_001863 [Gyalolechia sp. 2 TL-2023]
MPQQLSHENRLRIVRLLLNKWPAKDISREVGCNCTTVYHIKDNLLKYGSTYKPQLKPKGRPTKIPESAKDAVEAFLKEHPEAHQKDVRIFLFRECGIEVHQSSVSRLLKGDCQNGKKGMLESPRASQPSANQLSPGRPLCGRPDCTQYHSPSSQSSPDHHPIGQQSSGSEPSGQQSPRDQRTSQQPSGQQAPGPRVPDQVSLNHHPSDHHPPSPISSGYPAAVSYPPPQRPSAQLPLPAHLGSRPIDAKQQYPGSMRRSPTGAIDPAIG